MTNEVDVLVRTACGCPSDAACRSALSDAVRDAGEGELADVLAARDRGQKLLAEVWQRANQLGRVPDYKLLWGVHFLDGTRPAPATIPVMVPTPTPTPPDASPDVVYPPFSPRRFSPRRFPPVVRPTWIGESLTPGVWVTETRGDSAPL